MRSSVYCQQCVQAIYQTILLYDDESRPDHNERAWKNALACVLGAVIMFVLTKVANKKEIGWLKEWSLTITILGAMIITALV